MNKLRLILDAVPNGMMVIDERGVIVFVNSHIEQMFGLRSSGHAARLLSHCRGR